MVVLNVCCTIRTVQVAKYYISLAFLDGLREYDRYCT